ncbi:hypothetical protein [Streptomyces sp. NPDC048584]|uniref:hypothetical protein n=1 Tax=Streptomyces sp. NPDC048584 TaxID=3365573 RepID=UPI0037145DA8
MVLGSTGRYPAIVSGVRHREPEFKRGIEAAVHEVAPEAVVGLLCVDVDIERALAGGHALNPTGDAYRPARWEAIFAVGPGASCGGAGQWTVARPAGEG